MDENEIQNRITMMLEADLKRVKTSPFDIELYTDEEINAMRNYLMDLEKKGDLLTSDENEIVSMDPIKILKTTARMFSPDNESGASLVAFLQSDLYKQYEGTLSEKPEISGNLEKEFSSVGGGSISGYTLPLGSKTKNKKKTIKIASRSFGNGKRTKSDKNSPWRAKTGSVFPALSKKPLGDL